MRKVDGWRNFIEQSPKQVLASLHNEVTSSRRRIFYKKHISIDSRRMGKFKGFFEGSVALHLAGFGSICRRPYAFLHRVRRTAGFCMPWPVAMLRAHNLSAPFFYETRQSWN